MAQLKRNDPCPCGSGKKYKRCCARAGSSNLDYSPSQRGKILAALVRFGLGDEFQEDHDLATVAFWGEHADEFRAGAWKEASGTDHPINYLFFALFDRLIEGDKTITDLYIERKGRSLTDNERRYLESLNRSNLDLFEVTEIPSPQGFTLTGLRKGVAAVRIEESELSGMAQLGDIMVTRLVTLPSGRRILAGDLYLFPPDRKRWLLDWFEDQRAAAKRRGQAVSDAELLKRVGFLFNRLMIDRHEEARLQAASPTMPDGEPVEPTTSIFRIASPSLLVRALDRCEDLESDEEDFWMYKPSGPEGTPPLASLAIDGLELVVQSLARAHDRQARALLERIADPALEHVETRSEQDFKPDQRRHGSRTSTSARPQKPYPYLTADLTHYLDDGGFSERISPEARNMGLYLGRIAASFTRFGQPGPALTDVVCRRRPSNSPCQGLIVAEFAAGENADSPQRILWHCPRCGDEGSLSGWKRGPFDCSERPEGIQVYLKASELRLLQRLARLSPSALGLLAATRVAQDDAMMEGTAEEYQALASSIAVGLGLGRHNPRAGDRLAELYELIASVSDAVPELCGGTVAAECQLWQQRRRRRLAAVPPADAPRKTFRLRVQLLDVEPPIWRDIEVSDRIPLSDLHAVLILAMGWTDTHLHSFQMERRLFILPDPDGGPEAEDTRTTLLGDLLRAEGDSLIWTYDFGDDWRHAVRLESIHSGAPARPRLLAGQRACPPEDCGGPPGYERLLLALGDPRHPEHPAMKEWTEPGFDPEAFDSASQDRWLERLQAIWNG